MRIFLMPTGDWYGRIRFRHHSIFEILTKKHRVDVLRLRVGKTALAKMESRSVIDLPQVRTRGILSYYLLNFPVHFGGTLKTESRSHYDVAVISNLTAGLASISASKLLGTRVVFDLVDYLPAFVRQSQTNPRLISFGESMARWILNLNITKSDAVIVVSSVLADYVRNLTDRPVHCIPNGVDLRMFNPQVSADRVRTAYSIRGKVVGFVGHIDFWVDQEMIVGMMQSLLRRCPDTKCLIVGGGPGLPSLMERVRKAGLLPSFVFTGPVPYADVPTYVNAIDVCLIPFTRSFVSNAACPTKLFEYFACAKPVVSTPITEVTRIAESNVVVARDKDSCSSRVEDLFYNKDRAELLGKSGRILVENSWSWDQIAKTYESVLQGVVDS